MKIVVLVKEVPDTYGARKLSLETGLAERGASEPVMDEIEVARSRRVVPSRDHALRFCTFTNRSDRHWQSQWHTRSKPGS